jgi:predicted ATPase
MRLLRFLVLIKDASELIGLVDELFECISRERLALVDAMATILKGYIVAKTRDPVTGLRLITDGLAAYDATEQGYLSGYLRALQAEVQLMLGEAVAALQALAEALHVSERTGERWFLAEFHRRIGEAHRLRGDEGAAAASFEQALAISRAQGAKHWELRAATGLARLFRDRGQVAQARAVLAPVYDWFTEGFDTYPLREAASVLTTLGDGLAAPRRG